MAKIIRPRSIDDVEAAFQRHDVVIYTTEDGVHMVLNPFGGGQTATEELSLSNDWKLTPARLTRVHIVTI